MKPDTEPFGCRMRAADAGKAVVIGDRQRRITQGGGLLNQFLGMGGPA